MHFENIYFFMYIYIYIQYQHHELIKFKTLNLFSSYCEHTHAINES